MLFGPIGFTTKPTPLQEIEEVEEQEVEGNQDVENKALETVSMESGYLTPEFQDAIF